MRISIITIVILALQTFTVLAATTRFAVIGDYGYGRVGLSEESVALKVVSWNPDFVISVGDNYYLGMNPPGQANYLARWDDAVGGPAVHPFYKSFIKYPTGSTSRWASQGASVNKFFPALGNHEWDEGAEPTFHMYFSVPGTPTYYKFTWNNLDFFAIDSDPHEPDGNDSNSIQATWLRDQLSASLANPAIKWRFVFMHHPPYSSNLDKIHPSSRWPFKKWGADAVFFGHAHFYERFMIDGIPYVINGLSGADAYVFNNTATTSPYGSQNRLSPAAPPINDPGSVNDHGYLRVEVDDVKTTFTFRKNNDTDFDAFTIYKGDGQNILDQNIIATFDDATGSDLTGETLTLGPTKVGLRFQAVQIPANAKILKAFVQFKARGTSTGAAQINIQGEKAPGNNNPVDFDALPVASRSPLTTPAVLWQPAGWTLDRAERDIERTVDIKSIIQTIVSRTDQPWAQGNALVLILSGTGNRTAWAYDGKYTDPGSSFPEMLGRGAPVLHVEWIDRPYTITDLGTLNANTYTYGLAINNAGTAAGYSQVLTPTPAYRDHGFWWVGYLYDFGGNWNVDDASYVYGMNDNSIMVGTIDDLGAGTYVRAFRNSLPGTWTLLESIAGNTRSEGLAINNNNHAVGFSVSASGVNHATLWRWGQTAGDDLGSLDPIEPSRNSYAYGINSAGNIVGASQIAGGAVHAYRTQGLVDIAMGDDLGTMGGSDSVAYAINDARQIVGSSRNSLGYSRAFIKAPDTGTGIGFTDLGAGNDSYAYAINNNASPQVVGIGPAGPFFWKNDLGCKNLQDFLPAGSQWILSSAEAINDGGQIVGFGYNTAISSYYVHGFIMTP